MNRWITFALVAVCAGLGTYLVIAKREDPTTAGYAPVMKVVEVVTTTPDATAPEPVLLARVIEITDLDPLLDPPAKQPTGVPFDVEDEARVKLSPSVPAMPIRIPPAEERGDGL
jgi:hypothetical protein